MSVRSLNWLKFGGLVTLAFALGLLFAGLLDLPSRSTAQEQGRPARRHPAGRRRRPSRQTEMLSDLSDAFAAVSEQVRPSVVFIRSQRTERASRIPPGMEQFFRQRPPAPRSPARVPGRASSCRRTATS